MRAAQRFAMHYYHFCSLTLAGAEPLPLAVADGASGADLHLERDEIAPLTAAERIHTWRESDGTVSMLLGRRDDAYLLEHPEVLRAAIDDGRRRLLYDPDPAAPTDWVRSALLNQTVPRVMARDGGLVVHASAVECKGRLWLFAGESGTGKSTLAQRLEARGFVPVADDCVELVTEEGSNLRAWSGYPASGSPSGGAQGQVVVGLPVAALYRLSPRRDEGGLEPAVRLLSAREAMMAVTENMFVLDPNAAFQLRELFAAAALVGRRMPAYELSYRWGEVHLARLIATLVEHATQLPTAAVSVSGGDS